MKIKHIKQAFASSFLAFTLLLTSCQTSSLPTDSEYSDTPVATRMSPERVDVRGSIVMRQYNQGTMMLEVDAFGTSPETRYNRAYVLVLPTTQIVNQEGRSISLSELNYGQEVAVSLRGGGQGNFVGAGVARKMWVDNAF